jgi:hypothetical protein
MRTLPGAELLVFNYKSGNEAFISVSASLSLYGENRNYLRASWVKKVKPIFYVLLPPGNYYNNLLNKPNEITCKN